MNEPTVEQPGARPEGELQEGGVRAYVLRHWRGQNSLAHAFWVNHVAGVVLAEILYELLLVVILGSTSIAILPFAVLTVALLGFYVWSIVGTWRTTSVSINKARPVRFPFWSYAVRVWLIIVVVVFTLQFLGFV